MNKTTRRKNVIGTNLKDFDLSELLEATEEVQEGWLGEYAEKLKKGSEEFVKEKEERRGNESKDNLSTETPFEMNLDKNEYTSPITQIDEELVTYVMKNLQVMSLIEMRKIAKTMYLPASGNKKHMRERLRCVFRKEWAAIRAKQDFQKGLRNKTLLHYDYLVVMDFECTCVEILRQYPHELIEFPAVLVDLKKLAVVDTFQTYVKPVINPILDKFCIQLTHIKQSDVDNAPYFPDALKLFYTWLISHELGLDDSKRFAFLTDGPCDFHKFMQFQCLILGMKLPHIFRSFINVKKIFEQKNGRLAGKGKTKETSLSKMLKHYNMKFEGQQHCGLDDAKNLAYLAIHMIKEGIELKANQRIVRKKFTKNCRGVTIVDPLGERRIEKAREEGDEDGMDRALWETRLPYKMSTITKQEFYSEAYLDCDSCDELSHSDAFRRPSYLQTDIAHNEEALPKIHSKTETEVYNGIELELRLLKLDSLLHKRPGSRKGKPHENINELKNNIEGESKYRLQMAEVCDVIEGKRPDLEAADDFVRIKKEMKSNTVIPMNDGEDHVSLSGSMPALASQPATPIVSDENLINI